MKVKNPVNWFEIYVADIESAKEFYSGVFDVEITDMESPDDGGMMAMFPTHEDAANAGGALIQHSDGEPGPGGVVVYFQCEDVKNEAGRVAENGGTLVMEKKSIGDHGYIAMFEDPDGNIIGLHSDS